MIENQIQDLICKYKELRNNNNKVNCGGEEVNKTLDLILIDLDKLLDSLKVKEYDENVCEKEHDPKDIIRLCNNDLVVECGKVLNKESKFLLNGQELKKIRNFNIAGDIQYGTTLQVEMFIDSIKIK